MKIKQANNKVFRLGSTTTKQRNQEQLTQELWVLEEASHLPSTRSMMDREEERNRESSNQRRRGKQPVAE